MAARRSLARRGIRDVRQTATGMTVYYAKVDVPMLRRIDQAWPEAILMTKSNIRRYVRTDKRLELQFRTTGKRCSVKLTALCSNLRRPLISRSEQLNGRPRTGSSANGNNDSATLRSCAIKHACRDARNGCDSELFGKFSGSRAFANKSIHRLEITP